MTMVVEVVKTIAMMVVLGERVVGRGVRAAMRGMLVRRILQVGVREEVGMGVMTEKTEEVETISEVAMMVVTMTVIMVTTTMMIKTKKEKKTKKKLRKKEKKQRKKEKKKTRMKERVRKDRKKKKKKHNLNRRWKKGRLVSLLPTRLPATALQTSVRAALHQGNSLRRE
jgi:mannitol-specific phosphotransferase system IIBC component